MTVKWFLLSFCAGGGVTLFCFLIVGLCVTLVVRTLMNGERLVWAFSRLAGCFLFSSKGFNAAKKDITVVKMKAHKTLCVNTESCWVKTSILVGV